jgi:hypothetical protein
MLARIQGNVVVEVVVGVVGRVSRSRVTTSRTQRVGSTSGAGGRVAMDIYAWRTEGREGAGRDAGGRELQDALSFRER